MVKNTQVASRYGMQELLTKGVESVFLIDFDAIFRNKFNYKAYQDLSKYFELIVLCLPLRLADLMDAFVAGATEVVISGRMKDSLLDEFMKTADSLVMTYQDPILADRFFQQGGIKFLSDRQLMFPGVTVYSFSKILSGPNYIRLNDFPLDQLEKVLR